MLLVGLTGGIGSGKSTVSAMLAERGAVIIDADAITRELQSKGTPVFDAMVERFGPKIVGDDGELDRPAVAAIVFADAQARKDLENIVHPAVGAEMVKRMQAVAETDKVVIYDVPLLVEARRSGYGAVIVVDVDPEIAVQRLVEQRGMDAEDARARIANQASREDRRAVADRVIDNSGTLDELRRQVDEVWLWLTSLFATLTDRDQPRDTSALGDVVTVFAVLWAIAALFHVLGPSTRASDFDDQVTLAGVMQVAVCVAALATMARPRSSVPLLSLAVTSIVSAWLEAPVLGNHWLVAAFVDVGIVSAAFIARPRRSLRSLSRPRRRLVAGASLAAGARFDRDRFAEVLLPLARWALIGFYLFAAFAKLNHAFFDTSVSCGTFYFDELAGSLGFSTPIAVGHGGWAHLVPIGVAGTELAIPLLLLNRRTRNAGVVVGLLFHGIIALDQTHLFSDFSSVLGALFCLFLAPGWASDVIGRFEQLAPRVRDVIRGVTLACFSVAVALLAKRGANNYEFDILRMWLWFITDAVTLFVVLDYVRRQWRERLDRPLALSSVPRWLWIVPVVVIFNGLTPYLEIKTAYSYNMYSNLRVGDGETNHLLLPRTFPVNGNQADLVRILDTDDFSLFLYRELGYDLPYLSLRSYLSNHPDVYLHYLRGGVEHTVQHAKDDPDLVRPVNEIERRVFALRAVDEQDPPRCQDVFLGAL